MLLQEIGRDASEVFLLMRRYDSMVLGAVGDVQALLGVSLQQLQDDVTAMYRNIKNPELGSRMERSYRAWRCEKPLEYELEMADGQWLHMSIAPCRNPAYELVHFHRSTAMHERERGYEQRLDKAEAASQFKTSFLFRMSHEIRTPTNGIIGMLTLMKGKIPADHAAMQYVEKAEELSDHMLSLINDILDMSRIEAGKVELENAPFSLRAFGKTLDDMFARQMEKKGVAFAVRYEELTADWVLGDSLRLNQVVINFISNAMKFTSEGSVTVTFRQMLLQGGKLDLMIRVKDTGVGMKPEFLERIFKPFEQEDASTTRRFGGTGLGMAISDQMVRLMGGQIVVESQPDVGSEFTVFLSLPVASAPQEEAPQKQPAQIEPVSRPMRLLMAEDNEINAMIAVEILQERGAQIEVAENGKIAEEKFAASPAGYYDAVLMDVQMPKLCGLGKAVFAGCKNLTALHFGEIEEGTALEAGLCNGCDSLQQITFSDEQPPQLTLFSPGMEFRFNMEWPENADEEVKLCLSVPEGSEESYISQWRYAVLGYVDTPNEGRYMYAWWRIWFGELSWESFGDEQFFDAVDAKLEEKLLCAENYLRTMLGMDAVDEASEVYHFRMAGTMTGAYRLAKTTPGLSQADLRDPAKLGLLKTDKIYYLDENAFARSRWLQKVWLPNELEGIYNTPFAMDEAWVQQGDTITVTVGENIPELMGFSDGTAFSFGVPDECLRLQVSENRQQALLEKWVPPLTGYATREKLWAAVAAQLGTSATQQQIEAAVSERMLQAENRLRAMMGLQPEIPEEASQASQSDAAQQEDDSTV